jgi:hypothetical protein
MGLELATGLFGLAGVIVGAAATTGSQLYLEKSRLEREARRARQMVVGELLQVELIVRDASESHQWPPIDDVDAFLPTTAWREYRGQLVDVVDRDLWDQLVLGYALLEIQRRAFAIGARSPIPISPEHVAKLSENADRLRRLRRLLDPKGRDWPL